MGGSSSRVVNPSGNWLLIRKVSTDLGSSDLTSAFGRCTSIFLPEGQKGGVSSFSRNNVGHWLDLSPGKQAERHFQDESWSALDDYSGFTCSPNGHTSSRTHVRIGIPHHHIENESPTTPVGSHTSDVLHNQTHVKVNEALLLFTLDLNQGWQDICVMWNRTGGTDLQSGSQKLKKTRFIEILLFCQMRIERCKISLRDSTLKSVLCLCSEGSVKTTSMAIIQFPDLWNQQHVFLLQMVLFFKGQFIALIRVNWRSSCSQT